MRKLLTYLFVLTSASCFAGGATIRIQCDGKDDLQLNYIRDAVVFKSEKLTATKDSADLFSFWLSIEKPVVAQILGNSFLVFPDDHVTIIITDVNDPSQWRFAGRNSEQYLFLTGLKKILRFDFAAWKINESLDLHAFKTKAGERYKQMLRYCEAYQADHKTSAYFNEYSKLFLKAEYLKILVSPIEDLQLSVRQVSADYFDEVDQAFLNATELTGYRDYVILLNGYVDYLTHALGKSRDDDSLMNERIRTINKVFVGENRSNMLLFTFAHLVSNGSLSLSVTVEQLRTELLKHFEKNSPKREQVETLYRRFQILGKTLPEELLASKLEDPTGLSISLRDILTQSNGKLVYVDFWASWCGPCKDEMPASEALYQKIKSELPVEFIYISIDKDREQWRKGMIEIAVLGAHYRVSHELRSEIMKYIGFNTIPHYVLIDRSGALTDYDAPRPSNKDKLTQLFKDSLKGK